MAPKKIGWDDIVTQYKIKTALFCQWITEKLLILDPTFKIPSRGFSTAEIIQYCKRIALCRLRKPVTEDVIAILDDAITGRDKCAQLCKRIPLNLRSSTWTEENTGHQYYLNTLRTARKILRQRLEEDTRKASDSLKLSGHQERMKTRLNSIKVSIGRGRLDVEDDDLSPELDWMEKDEELDQFDARQQALNDIKPSITLEDPISEKMQMLSWLEMISCILARVRESFEQCKSGTITISQACFVADEALHAISLLYEDAITDNGRKVWTLESLLEVLHIPCQTWTGKGETKATEDQLASMQLLIMSGWQTSFAVLEWHGRIIKPTTAGDSGEDMRQRAKPEIHRWNFVCPPAAKRLCNMPLPYSAGDVRETCSGAIADALTLIFNQASIKGEVTILTACAGQVYTDFYEMVDGNIDLVVSNLQQVALISADSVKELRIPGPCELQFVDRDFLIEQWHIHDPPGPMVDIQSDGAWICFSMISSERVIVVRPTVIEHNPFLANKIAVHMRRMSQLHAYEQMKTYSLLTCTSTLLEMLAVHSKIDLQWLDLDTMLYHNQKQKSDRKSKTKTATPDTIATSFTLAAGFTSDAVRACRNYIGTLSMPKRTRVDDQMRLCSSNSALKKADGELDPSGIRHQVETLKAYITAGGAALGSEAESRVLREKEFDPGFLLQQLEKVFKEEEEFLIFDYHRIYIDFHDLWVRLWGAMPTDVLRGIISSSKLGLKDNREIMVRLLWKIVRDPSCDLLLLIEVLQNWLQKVGPEARIKEAQRVRQQCLMPMTHQRTRA